MMILIALCYFLLVCGLGAVFLGPQRHGPALKLGRLSRHRRLAAVLGACLLVPPLFVALLSSPEPALPGYDQGEIAPDAQVTALLRGERLVAPPPLPPLVFTTAEVEQVRPMLAEASRNWGMLHPEFQRRMLAAFQIMREHHGYEMALLEGYRSPERQDRLAAMGKNVTNARAFQSYHQFGLAADCAFLRNGQLVISERDPWAMRGYRLYGEVAESLGLTWGGRWKMMDFGHAELRLRGITRG
jgi:peptidoglycan L-alanyl-D-glutamate endopeptidase CwlK